MSDDEWCNSVLLVAVAKRSMGPADTDDRLCQG
jgi:hypothetical protein